MIIYFAIGVFLELPAQVVEIRLFSFAKGSQV
jgi:hypothetical protein